MMKKVLWLFLFCITTCATADVWNQFHTKNKECSIAFPKEPTLVQQSLQVENGDQLHYEIYLAPFQNKGVCMLLVATYPHHLTDGHEVAGLEGLLKGIVAHSPDNQLIFSELVSYQGQPAMNFLVQSLSNYFRGQAFMSGNKLFLIAMEGLKAELDEKTFNQFLQSFKIHSRS